MNSGASEIGQEVISGERNSTIRTIRFLSDKVGLFSRHLFVLYWVLAALCYVSSSLQVPASQILLALQELDWQVSESSFIVAAFLGLSHIYLTWLRRHIQDTSRQILVSSAVSLGLLPVSYALLGIQQERWTETLQVVGPTWMKLMGSS